MEFQLSNVRTRAALDIGISSHREAVEARARDGRPLSTSLHHQTDREGDRHSTRVRYVAARCVS